MKRIINLAIAIIIIAPLSSCNSSRKLTASDAHEVKNVILLIGDGMGLSTVYAAMTVSAVPLNIERATTVGLQKTYSANSYITDSGASATAIASGKKTYNGAIGIDASGNTAKSILEIAEENGLSTGLVATSAITHATPASFVAHQASRASYEDIALDFLKTDIDVFIGGGYNHFAKRTDKLNLIDSLKLKGYEVYTETDLLLQSKARKVAGLTAPIQHEYRLKGRGDMLPASTGKAIEILSKNQKGFFLMVEGSQIDWAAHANAADTLIDETLDFDRAAGIALDFAAKNGHTLVIITADHETGGVTIVGGDMTSRKVQINFSTANHTADMLPVYAFGPGSEKFTGIYDNTQLFQKILASMKLKKLK